MKTPQRIDYLNCRKYLNELGITDKEINTALDQLEFTKADLTDNKGFRDEPTYINPREFVRDGVIHSKEYKGDFVREYTENGSYYLIPAQYQGLKHGEIIFQILKNRFDWFDNFKIKKNYEENPLGDAIDYLGRLNFNKLPDKFKKLTINEILEIKKDKITLDKSAWSLYEMHSVDYEIYLTTEFGSLYIPIKALFENKFNLIKDRLESYSLSYHDPIRLSGFALNHRGRSKEEYKKDKERDYLNIIKPLESKEAKLLKGFLK